MKNQTAKFTSADDTLTISLFEGKRDIKLTARHRPANETVRVGCRDYFDLGKDSDAQAAFDKLVKEAVAAGWTQVTRGERVPAFSSIPSAPAKAAPRPAAAGRR